MKQSTLCAKLFVLAMLTGRPPAAAPPTTMTIGVVNYALERTLKQNRDKIVTLIGQAATSGCRLVVFPEGALWAHNGTWPRYIRHTDFWTAATLLRFDSARRSPLPLDKMRHIGLSDAAKAKRQ